MHYLAYDIKGIQHFIYSIPRLKCMIGASSQIVEYDNWCNQGVCEGLDAACIFGAGGHGAFRCISNDAAFALEKRLIVRAHQVGMDIRTGIEPTLNAAIRGADRLYPYTPPVEELEGFPCPVSGLWPVPASQKAHKLVLQRIKDSRADRLGRDILDAIAPRLMAELPELFDNGRQVEFFRNVNPERLEDEEEESTTVQPPLSGDQVNPERLDDDSEDSTLDQQRARAGFHALGGRNRWAIIAIDGNDMGRQFEALEERYSGEELVEKLRTVSSQLKRLTADSLNHAIVHCLKKWHQTIKSDKSALDGCCYPEGGRQVLVLPFRPVIRGGDDVVILAHSRLAMDLVETMAAEFARRSREASDRIRREHQFEPWPKTGGKLTISAGVLYVKSSLPLHAAIPYAESLLGSAKGRFRAFARDGFPTPAAVDWDVVTDSMIDSPASRRQREAVFVDSETGNCVYLTRRPYLLGEPESDDPLLSEKNLPWLRDLRSEEFEKLENAPVSLRAELERELRGTWSLRKRYLISLAKDPAWQKFARSLDHSSNGTFAEPGLRWFPRHERIDGEWVERRSGSRLVQETDVLDALLLMAEEHRMKQGR